LALANGLKTNLNQMGFNQINDQIEPKPFISNHFIIRRINPTAKDS
jgi:hypothetical protein